MLWGWCHRLAPGGGKGHPRMPGSILPVIVLLLSVLACGGIGLAYEHDLVKDYAIWATDLDSSIYSAKESR